MKHAASDHMKATLDSIELELGPIRLDTDGRLEQT